MLCYALLGVILTPPSFDRLMQEKHLYSSNVDSSFQRDICTENSNEL